MDNFQQTDLIQGELQKLLQDYRQRYDPRTSQQQIQARNQAVGQVSNLVNQPIESPDNFQQIMNNYLANYRPGQSSSGMVRAVGQGNLATDQRAVADRAARIKEQSDLAGLNSGMVKEDDAAVRNMLAMGKTLGRNAANRPVVKMDKDGNMVVFDPSTQETKVVHSSQRGEYQRIWTKAYQAAVDEGMDSPEEYAHQTASNLLGTTAKLGPQTPNQAGIPSVATGENPASIQYKDRPEEKRKEAFKVEGEKSALKDYEENVRTPAQSADSMLQTIGMVRQIPRTQDAFAPYREQLGSAMNALGMDGKMVQEAENLQQIRPLLAKIANDRLLMAKGVQTEGDAQRAYNEFIKISDTQKAADFMYAWTEELARRAKFKDQVYRGASEKEGTMSKGKDWWESTDYSKTAPVAILNGRPWGFTQWRDSFLKANPSASVADAIEQWNDLTRKK